MSYVEERTDERTTLQLRVKKLETVVHDAITLIENMRVPQTAADAAMDIFLKFGPWLEGAKQILDSHVHCKECRDIYHKCVHKGNPNS
jgi:hypothetical protein